MGPLTWDFLEMQIYGWIKPSRWFWCIVEFEKHWYKIYRPGITLSMCTFGNISSERLGDLKSHTADKLGTRAQVYLLLFLAVAVYHSQHQIRASSLNLCWLKYFVLYHEICVVYWVVNNIWLHNWCYINELT